MFMQSTKRASEPWGLFDPLSKSDSSPAFINDAVIFEAFFNERIGLWPDDEPSPAPRESTTVSFAGEHQHSHMSALFHS